MRYFVDGNNLGHFLFGKKSNEDIYNKTINFLLTRRISSDTTVVFDGFPTLTENEQGILKVHFSKNRKADKVIIEKISNGDVVVTNDIDLQIKCRLKRAKVLDICAFMSQIERKAADNEKPQKEDDIEGWLKKFSGKNEK